MSDSGFAGQWLCGKLHTRQPVLDQRTNIAVVTALRRGQYRTVVLAKRQQRLLVTQAFQQRQAQGLARTFVLPGGVFHAAIGKGLWLVVVTGGNKGQGIGKNMFAAV